MNQDHQIKRGVNLNSFQEEFFLGKMNLEDCIAASARLGSVGIESIAEQMMPGFPNLPDSFYERWQQWMVEYNVIPCCHDAFLDTQRFKNRSLTDDEMLISFIRDLKHAQRLGCPVMRVLSITPLHILEMAAPFAEQYNVKMGVEVHAPLSFRHEWILKYNDLMEKLDSPYLGFIPDTSIFTQRYPRLSSAYFIRQGAKKTIVEYISSAYEQQEDLTTLMEKVTKIGGGKLEQAMVFDLGLSIFEDPADMLPFMKRIFNIHAKCYEMVNERQEFSMPYAEIIRVLIEGGYNGYLCTEYEGHQYIRDAFAVDSFEQVRRQHVMFKHLLNENGQ